VSQLSPRILTLSTVGFTYIASGTVTEKSLTLDVEVRLLASPSIELLLSAEMAFPFERLWADDPLSGAQFQAQASSECAHGKASLIFVDRVTDRRLLSGAGDISTEWLFRARFAHPHSGVDYELRGGVRPQRPS